MLVHQKRTQPDGPGSISNTAVGVVPGIEMLLQLIQLPLPPLRCVALSFSLSLCNGERGGGECGKGLGGGGLGGGVLGGGGFSGGGDEGGRDEGSGDGGSGGTHKQR
jgi:hypothetical protein